VLQLGVVMAVCAALAAVLIPFFAQARSNARGESRGAPLAKAVGMGGQGYVQDYDESVRFSTDGERDSLKFGRTDRGRTAQAQVKAQAWFQDANESPVQAAPGGPARTNIEIRHAPDGQSSARAAVPPVAPDRYLIRNANLAIEVKDARAAYTALSGGVKGSRGYLSNLQEIVDALGARTITMQVRVPSNLFESSLAQLTSLGKVMSKNVTADDVTEEYVDTESTLRNLKRTEDRLLAHLSRTGRLSDTLLVEKELTRVREEIEQREGRLRFLGHRVQFSTVDVMLREEAKAQPAVPPTSYSSGKEASDASRSLFTFLREVWTTVIWIGIWSVVWAPLLFVTGWTVRRAWRVWSS
jgi:hypothetical protein